VGQAGVPVSVSIASGGGSLTGATTVNTASNGRATFTGLGIHGTVGPRTLAFTSPDLTAVNSGTIDLSAGAAALIAARDGSQQTAAAGGAVAIRPSVIVTDADNNRVSGVPVTFQVASGGGTVDPATPVSTNADGIAAVTSWTLGPAQGANTLSATSSGLTGSPIIFNAIGSVAATIRGAVTISSRLLAHSGGVTSAIRFPTGSKPRVADKVFRGSGAHRGPRLPKYTTNELIVTYRPRALGMPAVGAAALASQSAAALVTAELRSRLAPSLAAYGAVLSGVSPAILSARVRVAEPTDIPRVAAALRLDPALAVVERNGLVYSERMSLRALPIRSSNDPLYAPQAWHYGMIDLPESWTITTGSAGVLVAVIDDGIRFDHPDIAPNLTRDGYDFVSNSSPLSLCAGGTIDPSGDGDGYDPDPTKPVAYHFDETLDCVDGPDALGNHGLHVAGTIGAMGNNGLGVSGINWTVSIRPVRVLGVDGVGTNYDIAQGILYAAGLPADNGAGGTVQAPTGAKIINMSLGGSGTSAVAHNAVIAATNAGALIVASAGNSATSDPNYPAAFPEALSVSAVGPDRELASFSSFGSTVDIAAPGGDFDDGSESYGVLSTIWDFSTNGPTYAFAAGTSMAAPHVTGVAALLLAQNPGLSRSELRSLLTTYAVDAGASGNDDRYGAGIVNARNSLAKNFAPPRQLRARLYDALTGAALQTAMVTEDGSYSFSVGTGTYHVFAGQDESADQLIGLPGRRWGAFGGSATPSAINVSGAATHQASFSMGFPLEQEPNDVFANENVLPLGGYLVGIMDPTEVDVFQVLIPDAGQYTFETPAVDGACGFALQEDTILNLYDVNEALVSSNDDISTSGLDYCSRITASLVPGAYHVAVRGLRGGLYRVQARTGP
jgi:subtilisin family serine protease